MALKQTHYFANKGPSSQGCGFSSSHVRMRELDCEESWVPKNWCFWTVVLEKTLESPLDCKEVQPVHSKGDQSWVFFGRNDDAKAETPVLWLPHVKSWLIGKNSDGSRGNTIIVGRNLQGITGDSKVNGFKTKRSEGIKIILFLLPAKVQISEGEISLWNPC